MNDKEEQKAMRKKIIMDLEEYHDDLRMKYHTGEHNALYEVARWLKTKENLWDFLEDDAPMPAGWQDIAKAVGREEDTKYKNSVMWKAEKKSNKDSTDE